MFHTKFVNAELLQAARKKKGLSQQQLAEAAGCSKRTVERAEDGENLRPKVIAAIARQLDLPLEQLILERDDNDRLRELFEDYLRLISDNFDSLRILEIRTISEGAMSQLPVPPINQLFVEPFLTSHSISPEETPRHWRNVSSATEILAKQVGLTVVLGDPGSGKSSLVAYITHQLAQREPTALSRALQDRIPIPIVLREMRFPHSPPLTSDHSDTPQSHKHSSNKESDSALQTFPRLEWEQLIDSFYEWCGSRPGGARRGSAEMLKEQIRDGRALIMLDGLDELPRQIRLEVRNAVWDLIDECPNVSIICTSRPLGYAEAPFEKPDNRLLSAQESDDDFDAEPRSPRSRPTVWYLSHFDDNQIRRFTENWYKQRVPSDKVAKERADSMWLALDATPATHTLARIPNILTFMVLLHEQSAVLPEGRGRLYAAITHAYLFGISEARGLQAPGEMRATPDEQKMWLGRVAWEVQTRRCRDADISTDEVNATLFSDSDLRMWLKEELEVNRFVLRPEDYDEIDVFISHVQKSAGLLIPRSNRMHSFAHLSFLEYFAGYYLLKRHVQITKELMKGSRKVVESVEAYADVNRSYPDFVEKYTTSVVWQESLIDAVEEGKHSAVTDWKSLVLHILPKLPDVEDPCQMNDELTANRLILLTRLSEDAFTGLDQFRDSIRERCLTFSKRYDKVQPNRARKLNRFLDRWLGEIDDNAFQQRVWREHLEVGQKNLSKYNYASCAIGDLGVSVLVDVLVSDGGRSGMEILELRDNNISSDGIRPIVKMITSGLVPRLHTLGLGGNRLGDTGAALLESAIRAGHLGMLKYLSLWENGIGEERLKSICHLLTSLDCLPYLERLYVGGNDIDDSVRGELRDMLAHREKNTQLRLFVA